MSKKNKHIKSDLKVLPAKGKLLPKNRNGIVVFQNNEDIIDIFLEKVSASEEVCHKEQEMPGQKNGILKLDRHGMPFLDRAETLSEIFTDTAEAEKYRFAKKDNTKGKDTGSGIENNVENENLEQDENFLELIENALKGKNRDSMMREKSDKPLPEPVPLQKRLKRYPPPQDEMDLHGYNAKEAQSRTENYLRNCWRNGLFTVQIIVGRGIHSPYGAVLPDVVEDLLIRLKREGVLLWFEWDRRTKSQSGAVIAYLKQFS
jgi:DNA-nicking Smr family endonuclease